MEFVIRAYKWGYSTNHFTSLKKKKDTVSSGIPYTFSNTYQYNITIIEE
jgi:hypothetical protein